MKRIAIEPRANLAARAAETGFDFHTVDGAVYWDESAYYAFSLDQIEQHIEAPTAELAQMCLDLVDRVAADERLLTRLAIPNHAWDLIASSWRRADPCLYGRFDFAYDGHAPVRLLEYNADTPTALFEAAVFQWIWLEDCIAAGTLPAGSDQFNSIHEALIARLGEIRAKAGASPGLHLACMKGSAEDQGLVAYLADCAGQAGFATRLLAIEDIGSIDRGPFIDLDQAPIRLLFKLYPWEWLFADAFARKPSMRQTRFIEPPWKAILSNKGILPLLWALAPGHPNLLEAYFEDDPKRADLGARYVRKPLYSREGANVELIDGGAVHARSGGTYGAEGHILQSVAALPAFDGNHPVIGSWVIGAAAAGIGVREDASPITTNASRFVPHAILA